MRIGVDCDGVLTDMSAYICEYGEKWFRRKPTNPSGYSLSDVFGCTEEEEFRFGLKYFFFYCKKWPPRNRAVDIVKKLNNDGHSLYEITARKFVTKKNLLGWYSRLLYKKWLKNNEFHFQDIYFCSEEFASEDKLAGCRKYQVDVMVEDRDNVALYLAENGVKVLLFDAPYNQGVEHENIVRVTCWEEVYREIGVNKEIEC